MYKRLFAKYAVLEVLSHFEGKPFPNKREMSKKLFLVIISAHTVAIGMKRTQTKTWTGKKPAVFFRYFLHKNTMQQKDIGGW